MTKETDDRSDWDQAWAAMPHRRLPCPLKIDVPGGEEVVDASIAGVPPQYTDKIWFESDVCPICGELTTEATRLPGSLNPKLSNGVSYGKGVWVHKLCFEKCPITDDPTPIPW